MNKGNNSEEKRRLLLVLLDAETHPEGWTPTLGTIILHHFTQSPEKTLSNISSHGFLMFKVEK